MGAWEYCLVPQLGLWAFLFLCSLRVFQMLLQVQCIEGNVLGYSNTHYP